MIGYIPKQWLALCILLLLIVVSGMLAGQAIADVAAQANQTKTLDRDLEPVILKGSQISALLATPIQDLYVYKFNGNSLSGPIPAQVDEVTLDGSYTSTEDNLLDANDEIVFMAQDLGDRPADTSALSGLPISTNWYEVEVIDPLNASKRGWAYLVRRNTPATISGDYVDYNTTTRRITTNPDRYELGLASTYVGLEYLTLNGNSTDILDRTKIRAVFDAGLLGTVTLTEEDLENPGIVLVKDGRIRVILEQNVTADPGGPISQASLSATNLAYPSMLSATATISFTLPGFMDITGVRTSVDLASDASGAKFYNANTPSGGVTINGIPDTVPQTPLSRWAQVTHTSGRLIQVGDPTPAGGTPANFYCDDSNWGTPPDCDQAPNTGDGFSYGDAGILTQGNLNRSFAIQSSLFILPPPGGGQDNVGATYEDYVFNPLIAAPYLQGERSTIFLPIIFRNSQ